MIREINREEEYREIKEEFSLLEICLYSTEFQRKINKMSKDKLTKLDKIIKDYVGKIRKIRDCMYEKELLPKEARVETTNYRPML